MKSKPSEQQLELERGYRYYKAMELHRRGYVIIRDAISDFLHRRYWGIRRQDLPSVALELTDLLMAQGSLAVYQAGVNEDNWREQREREERRKKEEISDAVRERIGAALDDQQRQHERQLAALEQERENERYRAELLRGKEIAEQDAARKQQAAWRERQKKGAGV